MKLPETNRTGIGTPGALCVLIVYLVATNQISAWWMIAGVWFYLISGLRESGTVPQKFTSPKHWRSKTPEVK